MNGELTALDAYTNRVYKIIMLIVPFSCLSASATVTVLHYTGNFPDVNELLMWIFNLMTVLYLAIGIYFIKTGFGADGRVLHNKLVQGKYAVALIAIIQWNAISYIWPFRDFWAYCILFTLGEAFFFDTKLVRFTTLGLLISMFVSWIINGERLLPLHDSYYTANMTFRVVGIILTLMCINTLTFFGGKFLVEELEKYVDYDTLTHLLNRRKLDGCMQEALEGAKSGNKDFCLIMLDIDDFKKVNDTYGHDCGDEVLKFVANKVSAGVKKDDSVFRWGGEEILVIMRADKSDAVDAAERIRKEIEKSVINYRCEVNVNVTVTIGISAYQNGTDAQLMMDDADKKLYYGKHNGKNRVVSEI